MPVLPTRFAQVILCFAGFFCQRTWQHAQLLLMGAVLVPGARTVASVLRVLGLAGDAHFVNFHRVLNRAMWSPRVAARVLLGMLVRAFVTDGPIVLGIDDTIERRRGSLDLASPHAASTVIRCACRPARPRNCLATRDGAGRARRALGRGPSALGGKG